MEKLFAPAFWRFVKKQSLPLQLAIQDEVDAIGVNPGIGEEKKGDLAGFRVHKYRFAYEIVKAGLIFVMIGTHENFYRDLKKYKKEFQP
jgi:hypothetical protein